jgi:hypothetical protein
VSRQFAEAASELLGFMILVLAVGFIAPLSFQFVFIVNSIAGTVISDLNLNKIVVPPNREIKNNQISLTWGLRKILVNNAWWR